MYRPDRWKFIEARSVEAAAQQIIPYLEDTSSDAPKAIYFDGWYGGLGASALLRAIAENPGPSLRKKFDKIIHVDCSRWKSRRAMQRAIADELNLPQDVIALFDRQDEEDDFSGVEECSRAEITAITRMIYRSIMDFNCLLVFHNGSDETIDTSDFGFALNNFYNIKDYKMLWTFRGRLRVNPKFEEKVDSSHLGIYCRFYNSTVWKELLQREVSELIIRQSDESHHLDLGIATDCCLYLLSLNEKQGRSNSTIDYNWVTHACNYWVCDGIIQQDEEGCHLQVQDNQQAWQVADALHQEIRLDDYPCIPTNYGYYLDNICPPKRWVLITKERSANKEGKTTSKTTSLFVAFQDAKLLRDGMFHRAYNLRVLRLCNCTFSFSSPPFHCCHSLKFLGLDKCKDQPQSQDAGEDNNIVNASPALEIFKRLWVLDISNTDWELTLPTDQGTEEKMAINIREVHIRKGSIWGKNFFEWQQLQNLHKLRVIEPSSSPWDIAGEGNEFTNMMKLELLDLSGNSMMQVLPSLSNATSLKTLVLDGCVELKHVGPQELPPSLESFSLDVRFGEDNHVEAKISGISLAGCSRLMSFTLRGPLPNLMELDLSGTMVKTLDLRDEVVQVTNLQRVLLLGCVQLRAILWPKEGMPHLMILNIDTQEGQEIIKTPHDSLISEEQEEYIRHPSCVTVTDVRLLIHSLVHRSAERFCWNTSRFGLHLRLGVVPNKDDGKNDYSKSKKVVDPGSSSTKQYQLGGSTLHGPSIPMKVPRCYTDVNLDTIGADVDVINAPVLELEPQDLHAEIIGEGMSNSNVGSERAAKMISFVVNNIESLHMHDSSSVTSAIPERMIRAQGGRTRWPRLKWCHVERCRELQTVFTPGYSLDPCFEALEAFSAAELMMANCIWSKGTEFRNWEDSYFARLRTIHLHSCPRLMFVLPLSRFPFQCYSQFPSLETLLIVCCGELRQVFPVEEDTRLKDAALEFPRLKHIHLHDLPKLQHICESSNMLYAPELETIKVRGCWSLKRIPSPTDRRREEYIYGSNSNRRPIVDCEKDWWERLEWQGLEARHHPSLFNPRHSSYYRKPLPRVSVLR